MKKILTLLVCFISLSVFSQYLIVGKDSISAEKFMRENLYGLENVGIEKTVKDYMDFRLLQQFALEKKADTMSYFNKRMYDKEMRLRDELFYPHEILQSALNRYLKASQTERKIQMFYTEKKGKATQDYNKIYSEVKSGKLSMEEAIAKYTQQKPDPFFVKTGSLSMDLDTEIQNLPVGGYTQLVNTPDLVAFAKLTDLRPSLGYLVFGTLSYANNEEAEKTKTQIYEALKSGKKFEEVAQMFGSTENEKNNAGLVMGSPILPDPAYEALKNKKQGEYTEPILLGNKFYVFYVYSLIPYENSEKDNPVFIKEMMNSQFSEMPNALLLQFLTASQDYKETPEFANIRKSLQNFLAFKNKNAVMYQYQNKKFTYGDLKKALVETLKNAQAMNKDQWTQLLNSKRDGDVFELYSKNFFNRSDIKQQLDIEKQNLLTDYIFSYWMEEALKNNPKILDEHFEVHKDKYTWEQRADARVAIITEDSVKKDIAKAILNPMKWEALNKKYYGKTNSENQLKVVFEKGELPENADVFKIYKVPFQQGVHEVKIENRTLIIAIDSILPPTAMTRAEAADLIQEKVREELIENAVEGQRKKTKVTIEPSFLERLSSNFKK